MDLKSMTLQEMQEYMESIGEKKFRAKQIYEWFHKHLALSLDEMNNVPKKLKEKNEEKRILWYNYMSENRGQKQEERLCFKTCRLLYFKN